MLFAQAESAQQKSKKIPEYKVIKVINGGTISGKAIFSGNKIPKDELLTITSDKEFCHDKIAAGKYLINKDREIKNVVVYLADIKSGKEIPAQLVTIDNIKCAFEPHVSVGFIGKGNMAVNKNSDPIFHNIHAYIRGKTIYNLGKGNMAVNKNSDPIFHNIHAYIRGKTIYNLGIPEKGNETKRKFSKTGIMSITCNVHPWMHGYVMIFNHPYAAVTNEKGEYSIPDIPAGTYEVRAWHEGFGDISLGKKTVVPGKTTKVIPKFSFGMD
jgi:hypothetical protein